jgi:hypothetical protein
MPMRSTRSQFPVTTGCGPMHKGKCIWCVRGVRLVRGQHVLNAHKTTPCADSKRKRAARLEREEERELR